MNINTSFTSATSPDVREEIDPSVQHGLTMNQSEPAFQITTHTVPILTPRNLRGDEDYGSVRNFNDCGALVDSKRVGPQSVRDSSKAGSNLEKLNS